MSSVYENKFDVIFRKLQNEKDQLKKDFDSAYSKDDFRTSMGIMEEIQEVMNKLSALDSVEKPFKQMSQIADRVDDLKTEIEIHLEELGKQIKAMDELQELISGELETPMQTLRELFTKEVERNFTFEFDKFSDDELMTLIHYRKSNFPSRVAAYESYWSQLFITDSVETSSADSISSNHNVVDSNEIDLDVPLSIATGDSLPSNCYLDVRDEAREVQDEERGHNAQRSGFDHGVEDLSEFQRRNSIPMLTDSETSRILGSDSTQEQMPDFSSKQESDDAITAQEVEQYESEITSVDEPLEISVEEIEEDVMLTTLSKVESVAEISPDEDFAVSVDELDNEIATTASVSSDYTDMEYVEAEYTEAEYVEAEYTEAEYVEAEYTEAEYAEGEYTEAEYAEGEYTEAEYVEGEYTEAEYAEGEYAEAEYTEAEYTEAEYTEAEYTEGEYTEAEYTEAEYAADEYSQEEYSVTDQEHANYVDSDDMSIESDSGAPMEDDLPLDDLSIELEVEDDQNPQQEPLDIDTVSLDEAEENDQVELDNNILDIDDIEIDLDSDTSLSVDLEDEILDLDYSKDSTPVSNELEDELDLDDIEINLDEE